MLSDSGIPLIGGLRDCNGAPARTRTFCLMSPELRSPDVELWSKPDDLDKYLPWEVADCLGVAALPDWFAIRCGSRLSAPFERITSQRTSSCTRLVLHIDARIFGLLRRTRAFRSACAQHTAGDTCNTLQTEHVHHRGQPTSLRLFSDQTPTWHRAFQAETKLRTCSQYQSWYGRPVELAALHKWCVKTRTMSLQTSSCSMSMLTFKIVAPICASTPAVVL